ncbi:nickel pincer cofactor biosynthesis protein LarC [Desulfotomaculum nigrificans]|uniref:nickel pincer cofactor biosynthesis protein LarC n=1 Tax=Desulfotomaculum nigrificans TaxID=1565 RepID=UPI00048701A6|nr:nickel pincer cofactor biosynthesis protein LarC [Desulfotomaculum nigrificans]
MFNLKILYFDCFAGLQEEAALAALLRAGGSESFLQEELAKINVYNFKIKFWPTSSTTSAKIELLNYENQPVYTYEDMVQIIETSDLKPEAKELAIKMIDKLARAEAVTAGLVTEKVFVQELASLNSILYMVGISILISAIAPDKIMMSALPLGAGLIKKGNDWLPLPTPVTLELVKGIPVKLIPMQSEMVTPGGAAIAATLVDEFGSPPLMIPLSVGYGPGSGDAGLPNLLRVIIGEIEDLGATGDRVAVLETNIDDMNPEFYPFIIERLLSQGALDAFLTPIIMKKGRPAIKLSVLCKQDDVAHITDLMLKESSTLGIRISYQNRRIAFREIVQVNTTYGEIKVKVSRLTPGAPILRITPEYEDCRAMALAANVPISKVYSAALEEAEAKLMVNKTNNFKNKN